MFVLKKKYFLLIESIKDIDLKNIKKRNKFCIIYRNKNNPENIDKLLNFRKRCKSKSVKFYVANNIKLCTLLNSDGIYLSSYNRTYKALHLKKVNFDIIGSAHNSKEISFKIRQTCSSILLSKLFTVDYDKKSVFLGVNKFNNFLINNPKKIIPLGGIKINKLNYLKIINCNGFAISSEVKKKPANIINRLF